MTQLIVFDHILSSDMDCELSKTRSIKFQLCSSKKKKQNIYLKGGTPTGGCEAEWERGDLGNV